MRDHRNFLNVYPFPREFSSFPSALPVFSTRIFPPLLSFLPSSNRLRHHQVFPLFAHYLFIQSFFLFFLFSLFLSFFFFFCGQPPRSSPHRNSERERERRRVFFTFPCLFPFLDVNRAGEFDCRGVKSGIPILRFVSSSLKGHPLVVIVKTGQGKGREKIRFFLFSALRYIYQRASFMD